MLHKYIPDSGSIALIGRLFSETGREFTSQYVAVIVINLLIAATTAFNAWLIKDLVNRFGFGL